MADLTTSIDQTEEDEEFVFTVPEGEYDELVYPVVSEEEAEELLAEL